MYLGIWTRDESHLLIDKVIENGMLDNNINWTKVLEHFPGRNISYCSSRLRRMRLDEARWGVRSKLHVARRAREQYTASKLNLSAMLYQVLELLDFQCYY